jgi:uncharacterized membrane protein
MTISIAFLYRKFYPREINPVIGYRTKRSMASIENWLFSNEYSSKLLLKSSFVLIVFQSIVWLICGSFVALMSTLSLWLVMLISVNILTERKLKKRSQV